jgi:hypothetical protein
MTVSEYEEDVIEVDGGEAPSEGESWLAEQVRLITLEEGFAS